MPCLKDRLEERAGLYAALKKVDGSLAVPMQTDKIGIKGFLYAKKVPGVERDLHAPAGGKGEPSNLYSCFAQRERGDSARNTDGC